MEDKLILKEKTFDSSQYLPETFGKCHNQHGHTYTIRNLRVTTKKCVDFSLIKKVIDQLDHLIIIPEQDYEFWYAMAAYAKAWCKQNNKVLPCEFKVYTIPYDMVTVENLRRHIVTMLMNIDGVKKVTFELYETPNNGTEV